MAKNRRGRADGPTGWRNRIVGEDSLPAADIIPNPRNWRLHPQSQQEAMAAILGDVGWVQRIIVNRTTGHLLDGHLRVAQAAERGEMVPVLYVDLSEDEESLVLATLDPLGAMAERDAGAMTALLDSIATENDVLTSLLASMREQEAMEIPEGADDAPEPPDEPITQPGDLWLLGDHRVLCGDSTSEADVARLLDRGQASCMWTDPPYGVSYIGKTERALTISNDAAEGLSVLLAAAWAAVTPVMSPGAPFYVARPAGEQGAVFLSSFMETGWGYHEELQWVKDTMVLGHSDYHVRHETIVYGWIPGPGRSGRGHHKGSRWYGDHSQTTVFEIPRPKRSEEHPTAKPVALLIPMLHNSTRTGDIVLDPFLGSGTTLIAAEMMGRRCYGMEIAPAYVDVTVRRWEEFTGQHASCQRGA